MPRKILHLDLDAFFCAVEELHNPDLAGKPFAVGGRPEERGVVSSCSYAARACGVHSAMPMARAVRICPELKVIPPHFPAYHAASEKVMGILADLTPLLEQLSIDEAFLDVTDLRRPVVEIAHELQAGIKQVTGLPCSIGAASNKLVAKIATDIGKSEHRGSGYPGAIKVVPPGQENAFLAPLPVKFLWGVGPKTADRLSSMGVTTIGELAALPEQQLMSLFGKMGLDLSRHSRGQDNRPVTNSHEVKSISQEVTFDKDVADAKRLYATLQDLSDQVGYRMRQSGLSGHTIRIKLRWPDFSTHSRQVTLETATDQDGVIYKIACQLFEQLWSRGMSVRLLGVGVSGLGEQVHQPSLWETPDEKERKLLEAIDQLRKRYGKSVVKRGRSIRS